MGGPDTENELKDDLSITKRIVNKFHTSHEKDVQPHPKVEGYAGSIGRAVVQEILSQLGSRELEAVISNLVLNQAQLLSKQATSDESRKAARISAQEAFTGSYDAVERKWDEWFKSLPASFTLAASVGGGFLGLLLAGLILALWRFVLFGLGPIF